MTPQVAYPRFEANQGRFVPAWNWAAFLFGAVWYLVKGIWLKGLLLVAIALFSSGIAIPLLWVYAGVFGNWDHYLAKQKHSQLWG